MPDREPGLSALEAALLIAAITAVVIVVVIGLESLTSSSV
jgi:hypothetical protein